MYSPSLKHILRMKASEKVVADCSGKVCWRLSIAVCNAKCMRCILHVFRVLIILPCAAGHQMNQEESFNSLIIAAAPDGGLGLWHSIAAIHSG